MKKKRKKKKNKPKKPAGFPFLMTGSYNDTKSCGKRK